MHYLDLSDNTVLAPLARSLTIQDTRSGQIVQDAHFIYFRHEEAPSNVTYCPVLAVFRAGRLTPDGEQIEVESVELDYPHRAYGRKVLEGVATYPDGVKEEWRIQVDPVNMRFEWVRQPYNLSDKLFYRVLTPRRTASLQLWHTGSGLQVTNDVAATRGEPSILDAEQESELFFYSSAPKNCFRLETSSAGTLHIEGATGVPVHLPGEAGWDYEAAEKRQQPLWDMRWVVEGSS
ncbi:MAG: hypothetical protein HYV26_09925, partial [Candidatus Hydrogenedentes bacterium]|nr:hypothetical protein [Candidatus Hydrogenedentota bacterium]